MNLKLVHDHATQQRKDQEYLYLLIDPSATCQLRHPLSISSLTQNLGNEAVVRVTRNDMIVTPQQWPALIRIAMPGEFTPDHVSLSADYAAQEMRANKRYVCGWLLSEHPADVIASHIAQQGLAMRPAGDETFVPWFEPIRLALLHSATKKAGEVLGPIRSWLYPDVGDGAMQIVAQPAPDQWVIPDIIRDVQYIAPQVIELLAVWRQLNTSQPTYASRRFSGSYGVPHQTPTHAFNLIYEAHQQGLCDHADVQCLCLHMAMIHPQLLLHPTIQNDVAQAIAGKQHLTSRFVTYDDYAWQQIVAALPQARSYS